MMAKTTAWPIALPTDITTLAVISIGRFWELNAKIPPATKNIIPAMWNFLRPVRSETRPNGSMMALIDSAVEIATQVTARSVTSNSSAIDESASETIEKSITIANSAIATVQNTFQW